MPKLKVPEIKASDYKMVGGEQDCQKCPFVRVNKKMCDQLFIDTFDADCMNVHVVKKE